MLVLRCRDLGCEHCDFVASGDRVRQVEDAMFVHARDVHPHLIAGLTDDEREEIGREIRRRVVVAYERAPVAQANAHDALAALCREWQSCVEALDNIAAPRDHPAGPARLPVQETPRKATAGLAGHSA